MHLSFRTKLLAGHLALVLAGMLISIVALNRSLGADLRGQLEQRLEAQALGAAQWITSGRHYERLAGRLSSVVDARVTIFDRSGGVVGDSTPAPPPGPPPALAAIDPEVQAALSGSVGHATRLDAVAGDTHYVAVPAGADLVLRLAAPLSGIDATLGSMRTQLFFAAALAVGAALGLGLVASRLAARPLRAMAASADRIAQGDYDVRVALTSPDEFGRLAEALASLGAQLKGRIGDLTAERDRLSAILAGMVEGVLVTGPAGEVIVANPAARELLGAAPGPDRPSLAGRPLGAADLLPSLRALIARAAESGETQEAEIEPAEAGGRHLATYVRPMATEAGGGVVAVVRDMTEVRRFEAMRRDFVANVSHELRTPVTAIRGYAETLLAGPAEEAGQEAGEGDAEPRPAPARPAARQFLEIIHRQSERLGRLVEDLLRLSALEARGEPSVREPVPLGALAGHVAQTVRARGDAAQVAVSLEVDPSAVALGDPGDLEEVIENLVDNAIKYGRPGSTVRIAGERAGARVLLRVIDDGPGIAATHLPRIFERFYRVDPGRSRERGGTGLGLSIVQHLVESMGGTVAVESDVGHGCRFTVDLPAAEG